MVAWLANKCKCVCVVCSHEKKIIINELCVKGKYFKKFLYYYKKWCKGGRSYIIIMNFC